MKSLEKLRVLVANEPCTYREAISTAFGAIRPQAEVSLADPEDVDREVERLSPHLVLCSRTTDALLAASLTWMVLYPGGEDQLVIGRQGEEPEAMTGACFDALLEVLDETEDLYESA